MTKKVVIFGTNQTAQLANFYLEKEPETFTVAAFTVHKEFKNTDKPNK